MSKGLTCCCPCGEARVVASATPRIRFICHCKICQSVYQSDFANATIMLARNAPRTAVENVSFNRYRLPPALQRGSCRSCRQPVVGYLTIAPFLRLAFLPSSNFPADVKLPDPALHIFYDSRASDVEDELPKQSGYWASQSAVSKLVLQNWGSLWAP